MMKKSQPLLGFCPIGKFVFSHEDALRYKKLLEQKLAAWDIAYVGIDDAVPDGMVRDIAHVEPVVEHLKAQGVDGIFMPHCNFGTEGAVGLIGRDLGVPVLLWGPRDETPLSDGTRLRDTLCGLLASSKVLHKLRVPFTYLNNTRIDDGEFETGVKNFIRTLCVVKRFRRLRIGLVGQRVDFFWSTICNESELLDRFGIQVEPLDMVEMISATTARAHNERSAYQQEIQSLQQQVTFEGFDDVHVFSRVLAFRDELIERAGTLNLQSYAIQTIGSLPRELGAMTGFALGQAAEAGIPCACESDLHGAISMAMLQAATFDEEICFLADLTIRHPEHDDGVLLWHGDFALGLKKDGVPATLGTHWILPGVPPGMPHWRLRDGDITMARFDGDGGDYRLAVGCGATMEGPETQNTYAWMKVQNWAQWERRLIEGPYIHHTAGIYARVKPALLEACKYIPGLQPEDLDSNPDER